MKSVDIIFPVYYGNYGTVKNSLEKVHSYCSNTLKKYNWKLVLAINGPFPEKVIKLAKQLNRSLGKITYSYTLSPGKGAGIKNSWGNSKSDYLAYMDIDLSVDLSSLSELLNNLENNDVVIGSRYHKHSRVNRSFTRKLISVIYHKLLHKIILGVNYGDAHCGFKAITNKVAKNVLPHVQDTGWFFDSEFMYLLEKLGYSIHTIPVIWDGDRRESGLNMKTVIPGFMLKILELKLRPLPRYSHKK